MSDELFVIDDGTPLPQPDTSWLIDIGPFFDRFGASKIPVLVSTDVVVRALIQDVSIRKWVDLKRTDIAQALAIMATKGISGVDQTLIDGILNTPVSAEENLALRKLYFS